MAEIEVPTEHLHEHMHHSAHNSAENWILKVALSAALLSVLAAIAALLAGHYANEAMIEQIQASDNWAYYQAKGIKGALIESKMELLKEMGKEPVEKDKEKIEKYKDEQSELIKVAKEKETGSHRSLTLHNMLAKSVTVFQISIAICAISALTKRKWLWYGSMGMGVVGFVLLVLAFM